MSFLSQSFQSQSASNTASTISKENSTQIPLGSINNSFVGKFVPSSNYSVLQLTVSSNTLVEIIVEQSFLGVNYDEVSSVFFNTQEDIDINRAAPFYAFITLPFMRIIVQNIDIKNNTKLNLCTKLTSTPPPASEIAPAHVIIDGPVQVSSIIDALPAGTNEIGAVSLLAYNINSGSNLPLHVSDNSNLKVVEENSSDILSSIQLIDETIRPAYDGFATALNTTFKAIESGNSSCQDASSVMYGYDSSTNTYIAASVIPYTSEITPYVPTELLVREHNSLDILSSVQSIDGKITSCDTGAVVITSGNINIDNFPATQPISGSVSITGALPEGDNTIGRVNNFAFNTSLLTWTAMTLDNQNLKVIEENSEGIYASVASIDAHIIGCNTDAVIIASGSVTETNSAAIAASVASIDGHIIGCNTDAVIIASGSITETNSAAIAASVASIDGHIIGCNTDAVIIASGSITETNSAAIAASVASIDGHIIGCNTDAVIIASGSITETNSEDIATSVANIDGHIIACNTDAVIIASGSITETNSAAIAASVASIDSKIIGCNTDAVTITTALPTGSNTIGAVNLRAFSNIIPDFVQLNSVPNGDMNDCLCVSDLATINLEINANKNNYNYPLTPDVYLVGNDTLTLPIGTGVNRYREAVVMLKVDTTTYTNPQIMFGYSQDDINYYFDGILASWYDLGSNIKTAVLQRSNIPGAHIRIVFITDVEIVSGDFNLMKS